MASLAGLAALLLSPPPADACSCAPPEPQLWAPLDPSPAPLDARVTLALPSGTAEDRLVLRPVGGSAVARAISHHPAGSVDVVVLTPVRPLAPNTRFEVALIDSPTHPRTVVFGTFATGTAADTAAPALPNVGPASYHDEVTMGGTSCASDQRWIELPAAAGSDPDRPGEPLLYGVWLADAGSKIEPQSAPSLILPLRSDRLVIGATGMCAWVDPELPAGPKKMTVGIAAIDAAGKRSALQERPVTITAPRRSP